MPGTTQLQVSIEVDSDPITGSVSSGDAFAKQFTGWIDLVAAIEAARAGSAVADPQASMLDAGGKTLGSLPGANGSLQ